MWSRWSLITPSPGSTTSWLFAVTCWVGRDSLGWPIPGGYLTLLSLSASSSGFTQRHASVERVRDMGCELFNVGALGLHHYTLNRSRATTELRTMLAWRRLERAGSPRNDEAIFAS